MDHHVAYSLGAAYAQLGRLEEARTWLDRAVTSGFPCYPWYASDPLLESFRRDSSGRAFLERLRRSGLPRRCATTELSTAAAASRPLIRAP